MDTSSESVQDIKMRIKDFLFRFVRKRNLQDSDDFFASGMVNSLFAMQLVLFVEKEFGIKVQSEDLDLKNFRTVEAISGFVQKKRALG